MGGYFMTARSKKWNWKYISKLDYVMWPIKIKSRLYFEFFNIHVFAKWGWYGDAIYPSHMSTTLYCACLFFVISLFHSYSSWFMTTSSNGNIFRVISVACACYTYVILTLSSLIIWTWSFNWEQCCCMYMDTWHNAGRTLCSCPNIDSLLMPTN